MEFTRPSRPIRHAADWVVNERPPPTSSDPFRAHPTYRVPQLVDRPVLEQDEHILALVHGYVPAHGSGAEHMLHALLRDSVRRGHQATVVCANAGASGAYEVDGVHVLPRSGLQHAIERASVMVGHLAWTSEVIVTAAAHRLPLIYFCHNDRQIHYWRTWLKPPSVTMTVWNSQWVADKLQRTWRAPGTVIRPPVLLQDYEIAEDPPANGYVTLVNVQRPKGSTIFYLLAHRPPGRRFLAVEGAYGTQQRPPPELTNVDWQPQTANMRQDVYARTRVLLVPSEYESWGRVAVEAMAAGIPVVANPTPGLVEALADAAIFVRLDAGIEAWEAALDILDDARTYRHWSRAARDRARYLDAQAHDDLDEWDRVIHACAAAGRLASVA